jgi:hypothetical protein
MKKIFEYKNGNNLFGLNYVGVFNQYAYIATINGKTTVDKINRFSAKNILVLYRAVHDTRFELKTLLAIHGLQ